MSVVQVQVPEAQSIRLISQREVQRLTGLSRSGIYAAEAAGTFPKRLKLGTATRYVAHEVEAWVAERIAERDAKAAA